MGGAQKKKHGAGEISLHARFLFCAAAGRQKQTGRRLKRENGYTALDISQSHQSR